MSLGLGEGDTKRGDNATLARFPLDEGGAFPFPLPLLNDESPDLPSLLRRIHLRGEIHVSHGEFSAFLLCVEHPLRANLIKTEKLLALAECEVPILLFV